MVLQIPRDFGSGSTIGCLGNCKTGQGWQGQGRSDDSIFVRTGSIGRRKRPDCCRSGGKIPATHTTQDASPWELLRRMVDADAGIVYGSQHVHRKDCRWISTGPILHVCLDIIKHDEESFFSTVYRPMPLL